MMNSSPQPMSQPPVVVVGAGIVGVCCALYLQRDGRDVLLVDPRDPGTACSSGNSGLLGPGAVAPEAMPGILFQVPRMLSDPQGPLSIRWSCLPRLTPWLARFVWASRAPRVEEISVALMHLSDHGMPSFGPLLKSAGANDLVRQSGWLHLYESEAAFRRSEPGRALRRRRGVAVENLTGAEIQQMEPALAPIFPFGAYLPDFAHTVDPQRLTARLAEDFARNGGRIVRQSVGRIERGPDGVTGVQTDVENHSASHLVIAAGAWSKPLAAALGSRLPLETERGYHVMLPDPSVVPSRPLMSGEGGFAIVPMQHGLRIAGTIELAGIDAPPNYARADAMLMRARRMIPDLSITGRTNWLGPRPSFPDALPVIGPAPQCANAYFAFGHGSRGLGFAAVTGKLIAQMIANHPTTIDTAPYGAQRF